MSKRPPKETNVSRPLPTVTRDGQTYYDFDMFTERERVAFCLRQLNELTREVAMLRGALGEASDHVHVLSALVRKAYPLQAEDGTPLGLGTFLHQVEEEARRYQVAMDPTVTGPAAEELERQSLSHQLQRTLQGARATGLKAMATILNKIKADARAEAEKENAEGAPPAENTPAPEGEQKENA